MADYRDPHDWWPLSDILAELNRRLYSCFSDDDGREGLLCITLRKVLRSGKVAVYGRLLGRNDYHDLADALADCYRADINVTRNEIEIQDGRENRIYRDAQARLANIEPVMWDVFAPKANPADKISRSDNGDAGITTAKRRDTSSVNARKHDAVLQAFDALGREELRKQPQKYREGEVIKWVKAHADLPVTDRYVRELFNKGL